MLRDLVRGVFAATGLPMAPQSAPARPAPVTSAEPPAPVPPPTADAAGYVETLVRLPLGVFFFVFCYSRGLRLDFWAFPGRPLTQPNSTGTGTVLLDLSCYRISCRSLSPMPVPCIIRETGIRPTAS